MMEAKEKELIEKAGFSLKEFEAWNSIVNDYGLETKTAPREDIYFRMQTYIDHLGADYLLFEMRTQVESQLLRESVRLSSMRWDIDTCFIIALVVFDKAKRS